jgi:hypothetical protein
MVIDPGVKCFKQVRDDFKDKKIPSALMESFYEKKDES